MDERRCRSVLRQGCRMATDLTDPRRVEPAYVLDERAMLEAWLDYHRTTLPLKCEGLVDAGRQPA